MSIIVMQGSVGYLIWTICYLSVLLVLSAYGVHRYFIIYLFLKNRKRETVPMSHFEQLPKVTMQLPIFNEVYVVERLLKAVSEIDYPSDLLQIQVLDDSTDDTRELTKRCVEELRARGLNVELINRTDRTGFKAGALETGLASAEGDFVCILDADFVPQPDLLQKTVHFFTDPQVAAVGYTLAGAREAGLDVRAVDVGSGANAGGSFVGRNAPGTARIVVDESRRVIVGATFTGAAVAESLHAATVAVIAEVPLPTLWHAVPAFPTRSELWLRLLETYGL